jgi:putative membrane protein
MIVRDPPKPWELLFILRGSIVPAIWPQLLFVTGLSALVTWLDLSGRISFPVISPLPFSLIGIALSIFSGFRNSASYERWWEGRKLIGQLVINCRSLARLALAHLGVERGGELARLSIAFAHALAHHLRGEVMGPNVTRFVAQDSVSTTRNAPEAILMLMSRDIAAALAAGEVSAPMAQALEEQVSALSGVLAGAERIKHTPLPYAYSLLLHRTVYIFCVLLPFGLAPTAGLWTPILCAIVAYTFFGLDALGDELAAPFGTGDNALPLSAVAITVETNISEQLGLADLPSSPVPRNFVLS